MASKQIDVELLDCPNNGECLLFHLRVMLLNRGECTADKWYSSPFFWAWGVLDQNCQQHDWKSIGSEFGVLLWVKVCHDLCTGKEILNLLKWLLVSIGSVELGVFRCELSQRRWDIAKSWHEFGTVCSHSEESVDATGCCRRWHILDSIHFLGVWCNPFLWKHKTGERHSRLVKLTFFLLNVKLTSANLHGIQHQEWHRVQPVSFQKQLHRHWCCVSQGCLWVDFGWSYGKSRYLSWCQVCHDLCTGKEILNLLKWLLVSIGPVELGVFRCELSQRRWDISTNLYELRMWWCIGTLGRATVDDIQLKDWVWRIP